MEGWVKGVARGKAEEALKVQVLMSLECQVGEPWEG